MTPAVHPSSASQSATRFKVAPLTLQQYFLRILDGELTKIVNFIQLKRAELTSEFECLVRRASIAGVLRPSKSMQAVQEAGAEASSSPRRETSGIDRARARLEEVHTIISEFTSNIRNVQRLATFVEVNYTGFFKILKKFDKKTVAKSSPSLAPFMLRVDLGSVGWADVTAADVMKHPIRMFGKLGLRLYIARVNQDTATVLQKVRVQHASHLIITVLISHIHNTILFPHKLKKKAGLIDELKNFGGDVTVSVHDAVKQLLTLSRAEKKRAKEYVKN